MARFARASRRRGGFTLIELLVAIAILGILGTVVITTLWDNVDDAKQTGTKAKLDSLKNTVMSYRRKHNDIPDDLTKLIEEDPLNGNRPWLAEDDIKDTWGNTIVIKRGDRSGEFELISYGGDGQENGFGMELGYDRDLSSNRPLTGDENP
jgi:general secretion pathway protein G